MKNYEKKYKDLVKAVKELQEANPSDEGIQNWVNENVPELAESEDEQIRKEIIRVFKGEISFTSGKENEKYIAWLEKQKPDEWSEEDEYNFAFIQEALLGLDGDDSYREKCCKMADWLKSLKDRVGCEVNCTTTIEWSEEDERKLAESIALIRSNNTGTFYYEKDELSSFLKSLKERVGNFDDGYKVGFSAAKHNQWKPSEEQLEILDMVLTNESMDDNVARILRELREQLKRLREE